eukprot:3467423-Rhodomonas_salina.5
MNWRRKTVTALQRLPVDGTVMFKHQESSKKSASGSSRHIQVAGHCGFTLSVRTISRDLECICGSDEDRGGTHSS